jgi:acyl-CoA thioester hydrolase
MTQTARKQRPVTYVGVVYPWQADHLGHMNVQHYVGKFDGASWTLMALIGVDRAYIVGEKRAIAAVEQNIRYLREVLVGDTVTVTSAVREMAGKTCRFHHEMTNNRTGDIVATMEILAVHMDTESRRSCLIPDQVLDHARPYLEPRQ